MFERFTDRARRVLVLAQEESRLLEHSYIGTEHILLGLIREGDGIAASALLSLGLTTEDVREKVIETIENTLEKRRIKLIGHFLRATNNDPTRKITVEYVRFIKEMVKNY